MKAFGMEDFEVKKFQAAAKRLLRETMRWVRAACRDFAPDGLALPMVISLLFLFARDKFAMANDSGTIFRLRVLPDQGLDPIKRMGTVYQQFQQAQGATYPGLRVSGSGAGGTGRARRKAVAAILPEINFERSAFSYAGTGAARRSIHGAQGEWSPSWAPAAREKRP